jgi:hypothetical protein
LGGGETVQSSVLFCTGFTNNGTVPRTGHGAQEQAAVPYMIRVVMNLMEAGQLVTGPAA